MEETYTTKAIILNRTPFREFDEKVVLYSEDFGKIELLAKGAKKNKSKISGHIEPAVLANVMIIKGRQYDYLGSSINENYFLNIKKDLNKIIVTGKSIKLFNELVKTGDKDIVLYNFLINYLLMLNKKYFGYFELTYEVFMLKLLKVLGYEPDLENCLVCLKKIVPESAFLNQTEHGLICRSCFNNKTVFKEKINIDSLNVLKYILKNDFNEIIKLKINQKTIKEARNFILFFYKSIST